MWYAIISEDVENSLSLRKKHRPAHLERLQMLNDNDRLLIAGPHPAIDSITPEGAGFTGSLVVAEFESINQAQTWADQDPFLINGVYNKVIVKPFVKALP